MYDAVAMGELLIDFASIASDEDGYPTLAAHPGGAPANYLAAISKFGGKTAFIGEVGNDTFGKLLLGTLAKLGIDASGVVCSEKYFTTLAFVTIDATGNRSFSFARKPGADTQLSFDEVELPLVDKAKVLHLGTLSMTSEPANNTSLRLLEYARSKGLLISFDPNLRLPLWDSPAAARDAMLYGLSRADVVKISDEEVDFLWGLAPEEGAHKILADFGVKLVFVTCGPEGAVYANGNGFGHVQGPRDIKVVDTTGAGDIFGGSAMSRILSLGKAPDEISAQELRQITRFACAAASLSTTKYGALFSVPTEKEVIKLLECPW